MPSLPPSMSDEDVPALALLAGLARLHQTVFLMDGDGRVVWASDRLAELVGADGGRDVLGRRASELYASGNGDARTDADANGGFAARRVILRGAAERDLAADVSVAPAPSRCAEGLSLVIVRPVEEPEAPPAPPADYFRAILDSSDDAVCALDPYGFLTYANPALERLLGQPVDHLLGAPAALAFSPRGGLDGLADALRPGSRGCSAELVLEDRGAGRRVLAVTSNPIQLPDGRCAGTVAFLRDVTEQRRSEEELERKNHELEHYVHAVSHDLRTPLVSLLGFSRLLAQDYGDVLADTGRHFLERIEQASRTMESLINDLLELSRVGSASAPRDWVDPLPLVSQLARELKPLLDRAQVELRVATSAPLLYCARTQLYQVLANLIGNAVHHMGRPPGGGTAWVEVDFREHEGAGVLCVRDNGVGIAPEDQERVFEIFQTLGRRPPGGEATPGTGSAGTGMGLAIVKKIAERHGGRVWLESGPGRGAAFFVSFPGRREG